TISKPLNAIGKILSEALDGIDDDRRRPESGQWNHPEQIYQYSQDTRTPEGGSYPGSVIQAPYKTRVRPATPSPSTTPMTGGLAGPPPLPPRGAQYFSPYSGMDASQRSQSPSPQMQGRNLEAEIGAIEDAHRQAAKDTVVQIFPTVESEVIDMVLEANGGDLGRTIDALLEISASG
ncbi:7282_t:CDS:1, partial [Acaulospora colombiana]